MEENELLAWLRQEEAMPFGGWDFSHLRDRMREEPLPWSYERMVVEAVRQVTALLDMGTGGGEFLASLQPLPARTVASEGYAPNVPVARARLEPLGVEVHDVDEGGELPFADNSFDLVINRHAAYQPSEVRRVLRSGGRFITQQVGGDNHGDLNRQMHASGPVHAGWDLQRARSELVAAGLRIVVAEEAQCPTSFTDVGALVYYLRAIPWQIPDFSVDRYAEQLLRLHRRVEAGEEINSRIHRFLLVAEKG